MNDNTPGRVDAEHADALFAAALGYATRGWPVLPLHHLTAAGGCSCASPRCRSVAKHPRTRAGVADATTDTRTLRGWWRRWPIANVGIATGRVSGLLVLDVDARSGGERSLAALERDHGPVSAPLVNTSRGGFHLYFAHPKDRAVANRVNVRPGLDVKGECGYVVAPPSLHAAGAVYEAADHVDVDLGPAPPWLLDLATASPHAPRTEIAVRVRAPLTERARLVIRSNGPARQRFRRDAAELSDATPSGVDLAVASTLAGLGLDADEIAAAVRESRARAELPPKGARYLSATVRRALGNLPRAMETRL